VSVANVAVDLATNIFGSLGGARVMVLGTGEVGEATAKAFNSRGAADLAVAGRRPERASEVAGGLGARTVPFEERDRHIGDYDIVVCSTAAPETILRRDAIAHAMRKRPARPLLLIDLAMPRDIDAGAADLQNVFLYNLDDLAKIAEANRLAREAEIARCRAILSERAEGLWGAIQRHLLPGGEGAQAGAERTSGEAAG
jgi:glutamyl-tRNA reductase